MLRNQGNGQQLRTSGSRSTFLLGFAFFFSSASPFFLFTSRRRGVVGRRRDASKTSRITRRKPRKRDESETSGEPERERDRERERERAIDHRRWVGVGVVQRRPAPQGFRTGGGEPFVGLSGRSVGAAGALNVTVHFRIYSNRSADR